MLQFIHGRCYKHTISVARSNRCQHSKMQENEYSKTWTALMTDDLLRQSLFGVHCAHLSGDHQLRSLPAQFLYDQAPVPSLAVR